MSFERYNRCVALLRSYPHYDSAEEGIAALELEQYLEQGSYTTFIVRAPLGCFQFHRCYWQRTEIVTQVDFSITHGEMWSLRREAARELGEIRLALMDIPKDINEL